MMSILLAVSSAPAPMGDLTGVDFTILIFAAYGVSLLLLGGLCMTAWRAYQQAKNDQH